MSAHGESTNPSNLVGLIYPDKDSSTFLKAVLFSMNITFKESTKTNGQYIEWISDDKLQELEIQNRVSQYNFIKTVCKNMRLPSPSSPALKELSCK